MLRGRAYTTIWTVFQKSFVVTFSWSSNLKFFAWSSNFEKPIKRTTVNGVSSDAFRTRWFNVAIEFTSICQHRAIHTVRCSYLFVKRKLGVRENSEQYRLKVYTYTRPSSRTRNITGDFVDRFLAYAYECTDTLENNVNRSRKYRARYNIETIASE